MPNIVNFANPQLQQVPQQQISQSQILGQLLSGQLGPQLQQQGDPFAGLTGNILQRGGQDALLRKQQTSAVGNQVAQNILANQIIPGG